MFYLYNLLIVKYVPMLLELEFFSVYSYRIIIHYLSNVLLQDVIDKITNYNHWQQTKIYFK